MGDTSPTFTSPPIAIDLMYIHKIGILNFSCREVLSSIYWQCELFQFSIHLFDNSKSIKKEEFDLEVGFPLRSFSLKGEFNRRLFLLKAPDLIRGPFALQGSRSRSWGYPSKLKCWRKKASHVLRRSCFSSGKLQDNSFPNLCKKFQLRLRRWRAKRRPLQCPVTPPTHLPNQDLSKFLQSENVTDKNKQHVLAFLSITQFLDKIWGRNACSNKVIVGLRVQLIYRRCSTGALRVPVRRVRRCAGVR